MNELSACPFCGQRNISIQRIEGSGECWIECPECRVETPLYNTETTAVAAWNRRATESDIHGTKQDGEE